MSEYIKYNINKFKSILLIKNIMGANISNTDGLSKNSFRHTIDYIATYYIVTMDFQSLNQLANREYCNELIILTSDIISKYATTRDIQYLVKRQTSSDTDDEPEMVTRKVTYFNKNLVEREIPEMVKKDMCMAIASFYIRIAHLFSAIILTINPIYKFRDSTGVIRQVNWANRHNIPEGVEVDVEYSNICNRRINALDIEQDSTNSQSEKKSGFFDYVGMGVSDVTMKPSICHLQLKPNMLIDEPGIKELEVLYYDVYDYNEGKYTSMSPSSREQYEEDVREFYKSFTGKYNEPVPPEIKTFQDIPVQQYSKCNKPEFLQPLTISKNDSIFQKYADNLNEMKRYAGINQDKLMEIIGKLFVYTVNKTTGKKQIRINPRLNDVVLDSLIKQSRLYISDLYKTCQRNYDKGVHLYQDIVESTIAKTIDNRIKNAEDSEYEDMHDIRDISNDEIKPSNYRDFNTIGQYNPKNLPSQSIEDNDNLQYEPKSEPQYETQPEPQYEPEYEPKSEPQSEPQYETQPEPQYEPQYETQYETQPEPQPEPQYEPQPEPQSEHQYEPEYEPQSEHQYEPEGQNIIEYESDNDDSDYDDEEVEGQYGNNDIGENGNDISDDQRKTEMLNLREFEKK